MAKNSDIAYVSPPVVKWARERAGLTTEELATHLKNVKTPQINAWERGDSLPTLTQAEKLSEKLRVPLAVLFMENPPDISLPIPDLRTVSEKLLQKPSLEFFDLICDALVRQRWYREFQESNEATPLPFVGGFQNNLDVNAVADDMAERLGISDQLRSECRTWQSFFVSFVQHAERLGILVMRSGVVRHNPRRTLAVEEFRGFAISDNLAPLVFINSKDAKAAQTFTLAHELAHIWIGASGVSNPKPKARVGEHSNDIEQFCNQVAAQLLVPADEFERRWQAHKNVSENLRGIATYFRVSSIVSLRRAYELGKISYQLFSKRLDDEHKRFKAQQKEDEEGGGNFWASFGARNSKTLVRAVLESVRRNTVTYREAANLLGIRVSTLLNHPSVEKRG